MFRDGPEAISPLDSVFIAAVSIVGIVAAADIDENVAARARFSCVRVWLVAITWCRPPQGSGDKTDIASDITTPTEMTAIVAGFLSDNRVSLFCFGRKLNMVP